MLYVKYYILFVLSRKYKLISHTFIRQLGSKVRK